MASNDLRPPVSARARDTFIGYDSEFCPVLPFFLYSRQLRPGFNSMFDVFQDDPKCCKSLADYLSSKGIHKQAVETLEGEPPMHNLFQFLKFKFFSLQWCN
ncbi:hypothetical protein QAD02_014642 [Eretmocerus hayati]|uniref:Uncharacterized protein n=1 Tax=Eretmocerus hayati TaxID=131215 RepID=A0ACC2PAS8_9HYME|nr:hypothetical protein QAD02_014642 [Eretmocerus hayati]